MINFNFRKGFINWIKSPFGLMVFIIGTVMHILSWPISFYVEDDYEKLKWLEIESAYVSDKASRYDGYHLILEANDGEKYMFSVFGFENGAKDNLSKVISKGDKVGWYSTCFEWKNVKLGSFLLFENCAVIMEVKRKDEIVISFKDRVKSLFDMSKDIFFDIYHLFFLLVFFSFGVFVYFCKRNYE